MLFPFSFFAETTAQRKYTERVKKADQYRQAWINDILGNDQSNAWY